MAFFDFLHIFTDLFNSTEKAWHKLEPEVQQALTHGSGFVDIINKNIKESPQFIWDLIQKKYPELTEQKVLDGLQKVKDTTGIIQQVLAPDILTTIENLQKYFSGLQGKFWQGAASTISQLLAIALAPDETPFAKVVQFIEWVYRKIVNK